MARALIIAALVLAPVAASAYADKTSQRRYTTDGAICQVGSASACKVLSAKALNGAAATLTFTMDVEGYSQLNIQVDHTFSAATAFTVTCSGSLNGGSTYARMTATSISGGTGTVSKYLDSYATGSASTNIILEYRVHGYDKVQCVLDDTGADGSDLVTVYAKASVGGS